MNLHVIIGDWPASEPDVLTSEYISKKNKEECNILFNDVLNTFYLHLHNMRYVDNDHPKQKKCLEEKEKNHSHTLPKKVK